MKLLSPLPFAAVCLAVPYAEYIYAPSERTLIPKSIYSVNGSVRNPGALVEASKEPAVFHGRSSVTLDFEKNVAGLVTIDLNSTSSELAHIGITFSESSLYISHEACDATADAGLDSPLWFSFPRGPGNYTAELKHNRGGFRYMTVVSNTTETVSLNRVLLNFTAAPTQKLDEYTGYFHSNDELLNRIWYAGAYTNQLSTISPSTGNALPWYQIINSTDDISLPETVPWWSNYTVSNGTSVLTDGAKRDRLLWPGDMSISLESIGVSTYDLYSVRVALERLLSLQKHDGRLPYASPPYADTVSFTYHCHALNGISLYFTYSGDKDWLLRYWKQYKAGINYALLSVDSTGLANITASADWLRFGMGGHVSLQFLLFSIRLAFSIPLLYILLRSFLFESTPLSFNPYIFSSNYATEY